MRGSSLWKMAAFVWCLAGSASAWTCQAEPLAPFEDLLAKAPLAFVGKVESVKGDRVLFMVEHAIKGAEQGTRVEIKALPPSTCAVAFAKGQRWVYGGPSTSDPTYPLFSASDASPMAGLARQDDVKFKPKPAWQACSVDSQCKSVDLGCSSSSANAGGVLGLRGSAEKFGVASRRCDKRQDLIDFATPWCVEKVCGRWTTQPLGAKK